MADYYTQFSCELDVKTPENALKAIEIYETGPEDDDDGIDYFGGFMVSICLEPDTSALWIRDDGSGDPEAVIEFVKACAKAFSLTGLWGFEYANTCSKARLDAFGGGAHVLDLATGQTVDYVSTHNWLTIALAGDDPNA